MAPFEILGEVREIETIAVGKGIRDLPILEKRFGKANWRKLKGFAIVRLDDGTIAEAEVHWVRSGHRKAVDENQALS